MKKFFSVLIVSAALLSWTAGPSAMALQSYRGTVQEESHSGDLTRSLATDLFFIPRELINGTLWGIEKSAAYVSDPKFIEKVKDILYIYKRELAWFPVLKYASGFRPESGVGLYYQHDDIKALFLGTIHDSDYWSLGLKTSYSRYFGSVKWKTSLTGLIQKRDDLRYYGLGSDPHSDPRNVFITQVPQDYGVFTEDKRKLQIKTEISPTPDWTFQYLGFYQRRGFDDTGRGGNPLRDVFDLSSIPGFTVGSPVAQFYNEISVEWDTREHEKMISPGWRLEAYSGLSSGVKEDNADFFRFGGDAAAFIPVVKRDRILVPRITVDFVESIDDTLIPFTEYPRHQNFRGASNRKLIRSDEFSFAPSLEYQWPLTHNLSANIFFDAVAVGSTLFTVHLDEAAWATGAGVHFHHKGREFGRVQFAGGSEGYQALVTFGVPLEENSREDW